MKEGIQDLPQGWASTTLREIAEIVGGVTKDSKKSKALGFREVPYLRVANVQRGHLDLEEMKTIAATEAEIQKLRLLPGDILLNEGGDRDKLGRGWIWQGQLPECIHQNHVFRARLRGHEIDPVYIAHFTNSEAQSYFSENGSQTTNLASISMTKLGSLPIRLPPAREQNRIVDALDERLSELDAAVASLDRAERNLVRYRAAVLAAACSGKLVPSKNAIVARPLKELITDLGQGWSPKCDLTRDAGPDEWAIITTTAVQHLRYIDNQGKPLPAEFSPRPRLEIRTGDFLMTRKGPRKRAGVACLVRHTRPKLMVCDTVYRFRCIESLVCPDYLEIALNAPMVVQAIDRQKSGISESGVSLTHDKLGDIKIPVPLLLDQVCIVEEVDRHLTRADALAASIGQAKRRNHRLRRSILAAAFQGRLVLQNPNDEPASVLLDRIRSQVIAENSITSNRNGRLTGRVMAAVAHSSDDTNSAPKRRGRPPGSKNKAKS